MADSSGTVIEPEVYRRYEDGYVVRRMTMADAQIAIGWYSNLVTYMSGHDLLTCLAAFPRSHGFYVGELDGEVVASALRIPWSEDVFYGSFYYVAEKHRRKGYGTRLRDEVAREYVGSNKLVVDAVLGKVTSDNKEKYGYKNHDFKSMRWHGNVHLPTDSAPASGTVVQAGDVAFDDIMSYDDKHFIGAKNKVRRDFMSIWLNIPGGAACVSMDASGHVTGYGCRRPCVKPNAHVIGPLYGDSPTDAEAIMHGLCKDIEGDMVIVPAWNKNPDVARLFEKFGLAKEFELQRMYLNGDPRDYKPTVYALTSFAVCGF